MNQIVFIGLNYDQVPYLKILKELDYFIIGIDKNENAPGVSLVDIFINNGYNEYQEIEKKILKDKRIKPEAIFSAAAQFSHVIASKLAYLYDLNYPNLDFIEKVLDKAKFYNLFLDYGLPIPETSYIFSKDEMNSILHANTNDVSKFNKRFYIKSDYSKNPKYIYSGTSEDLLKIEMNWKIDTHFRACYIMQPEVPGPSLRVNIFGDDFEVYDFNTGKEITTVSKNIDNIINELTMFCENLSLNNWIIKFDVIDTGNSFVTLDIGIDPPSRMHAKYTKAGMNFEKFYLNKYLNAFK